MRVQIEFRNDPPRHYEVTDQTYAQMTKAYRREDALYDYERLPSGLFTVNWAKAISLRVAKDNGPRSLQRRVARPETVYI